MIKFLRAKHSDAVAYINRKWKTETGKASAAPVQYLFNHLLYYPYRRLGEGQKTEIQDTITRVINQRRRQIPVSYTFNISLLRRIKNLLKKEVRENPGVDTFGSLNNMLQRVHRYRPGQIGSRAPYPPAKSRCRAANPTDPHRSLAAWDMISRHEMQ